MKATYTINGIEKIVNISNENEFICGINKILSDEFTDITFHQNWYNDGYTNEVFLDSKEFDFLKDGITNTIKNIIKSELDIEVDKFTLENYHKFVKDDESHFKIVSKTRDLFSDDFNFPIKEMMPKFEKILGFELTDLDLNTNVNAHIILRINRPNSSDFNPPHKDMYEGYDGVNNNGISYFPKFLNFWIPIAGVTDKSSLPIAPKSHLVPENLITRTLSGSIVENKKYRVRLIKDWNGNANLIRSNVTYGEVLIFSSHLIHGLALNEEVDTTRVALEFRLYKR